VKALACMELAVSAAWESVCTRTLLKSAPNRGSKKARVSWGNGFPPPFIAWMLAATEVVTLGAAI